MVNSVLVVDDDVGFRDLVGRILTGCGFRVVGEAGGVAEAMTRALELRPDAALVDISLPDGDGFTLTEQLTALSWPMVVVLISSDADRANATVATRVGARSFLPKDELTRAALRQLLEDG